MFTAKQARYQADFAIKKQFTGNTLGPVLDAIKELSQRGEVAYQPKYELASDAIKKLESLGYKVEEGTISW